MMLNSFENLLTVLSDCLDGSYHICWKTMLTVESKAIIDTVWQVVEKFHMIVQERNMIAIQMARLFNQLNYCSEAIRKEGS